MYMFWLQALEIKYEQKMKSSLKKARKCAVHAVKLTNRRQWHKVKTDKSKRGSSGPDASMRRGTVDKTIWTQLHTCIELIVKLCLTVCREIPIPTLLLGIIVIIVITSVVVFYGVALICGLLLIFGFFIVVRTIKHLRWTTALMWCLELDEVTDAANIVYLIRNLFAASVEGMRLCVYRCLLFVWVSVCPSVCLLD